MPDDLTRERGKALLKFNMSQGLSSAITQFRQGDEARGIANAVRDLGLGDLLNDQLSGETEEQRRKRKNGLNAGGDGAASMLLGGVGANGG